MNISVPTATNWTEDERSQIKVSQLMNNSQPYFNGLKSGVSVVDYTFEYDGFLDQVENDVWLGVGEYFSTDSVITTDIFSEKKVIVLPTVSYVTIEGPDASILKAPPTTSSVSYQYSPQTDNMTIYQRRP